jgi:hypothetical protein
VAVILNVVAVILSVVAVILSEAKDLLHPAETESLEAEFLPWRVDPSLRSG